MVVGSDVPERYRVGGVFGVDFSGRRLLQFFNVAMVRSDNHRPADFEDSWDNDREAFIGSFNRFDGSFFIAGVSHHIRVGIIDENEIIFVFGQCGDESLGDLRGTHFRNLIKMRDGRRRDEKTILPGECLFVSTVEKVGDMGVFFRLGYAELLLFVETEGFAEAVLDILQWEMAVDTSLPEGYIIDTPKNKLPEGYIINKVSPQFKNQEEARRANYIAQHDVDLKRIGTQGPMPWINALGESVVETLY